MYTEQSHEFPSYYAAPRTLIPSSRVSLAICFLFSFSPAILLPVPRVPHVPCRPFSTNGAFLCFGEQTRRPLTLFLSLVLHKFLLPRLDTRFLSHNRTDGCFSASTVRIVCSWLKQPASRASTCDAAEKYLSASASITPRRRRSLLVAPVHLALNANRSTLRFRHAATFPVPQEPSFHRLPSFATTAAM